MPTINYGKVVETGGNPVVRIVVAAVVLVMLMILFFSSVVTVRTGQVAVLTLFGRVKIQGPLAVTATVCSK